MTALSIRRTTVLGLLHLLALGTGILIWYGTSSAASSTASVSAANHCTNYFPTSYTPDVNCNVNGSVPGGAWGQTSSTALRDSNYMSVTATRWISVWYGENSPVTAYGTYVSQGSSSGYAVAGCKLDDVNSATGRCQTAWHD